MISLERFLLRTTMPLAAMLAIAGCGPGRPATVPVTGTVTLDGQPVAGASVMFSPAQSGHPASGRTDQSGNFTVRTFEPGDGALPGRHTVTVTLQKTAGMTADPDGLEGDVAPGGLQVEWIVPRKYASQKTSGLTVEVQRGMEPVRLELTSD